MNCKRVFLVNISGLGVGQIEKAPGEYNNTLKNLYDKLIMFLPNFLSLGLGKIREIKSDDIREIIGSYGFCNIKNNKNNAFMGQWELSGAYVGVNPITFGEEVPSTLKSVLENAFKSEVLCCKKMNSANALAIYGQLSTQLNSPIVYISEDNGLTITCHENLYNHEQLNQLILNLIDNLPREICIERINSRIFAGRPGNYYHIDQATTFVAKPKIPTMFDKLKHNSISVCGIGKIEEYFGVNSFTTIKQTKTNDLALKLLIRETSTCEEGLVYVNLTDTDQVFGQHKDFLGYRKCLEDIDMAIGQVIKKMRTDDLLIILSDHGCDPTVGIGNEKKEYVPLLMFGNLVKKGVDLGESDSLDVISKTILDYFNVEKNTKSLLK